MPASDTKKPKPKPKPKQKHVPDWDLIRALSHRFNGKNGRPSLLNELCAMLGISTNEAEINERQQLARIYISDLSETLRDMLGDMAIPRLDTRPRVMQTARETDRLRQELELILNSFPGKALRLRLEKHVREERQHRKQERQADGRVVTVSEPELFTYTLENWNALLGELEKLRHALYLLGGKDAMHLEGLPEWPRYDWPRKYGGGLWRDDGKKTPGQPAKDCIRKAAEICADKMVFGYRTARRECIAEKKEVLSLEVFKLRKPEWDAEPGCEVEQEVSISGGMAACLRRIIRPAPELNECDFEKITDAVIHALNTVVDIWNEWADYQPLKKRDALPRADVMACVLLAAHRLGNAVWKKGKEKALAAAAENYAKRCQRAKKPKRDPAFAGLGRAKPGRKKKSD